MVRFPLPSGCALEAAGRAVRIAGEPLEVLALLFGLREQTVNCTVQNLGAASKNEPRLRSCFRIRPADRRILSFPAMECAVLGYVLLGASGAESIEVFISTLT
jgi:hypothetical protein